MLSSRIQKYVAELRCPACRRNLSLLKAENDAEALLECKECKEIFPVIQGIPRMLLKEMRDALQGSGVAEVDQRQVKTAKSFGYEWSRFSRMYDEWESNFLDYMSPHSPGFFRGKKLLDAGCGSGRHAYYAAKFGAEVWGIDLGAADVARQNTSELTDVNISQADLYKPPFEFESFDFVYSIGVLHHLPDPEGAFQNLLKFLKPGGEAQIYLYWKPEGQPVKAALLGAVTLMRKLTTRLPHPWLHALSYPAAVLAFLFFVLPYKVLRRLAVTRKLAEKLPMKQYADYPFGVCVNDQFDRFSAPIENRYTKAEVEAWMRRANLENIIVFANNGWVGNGRKPSARNSSLDNS